MRTLYLDSFSGISGDMFLGLLLDLGLPLPQLQNELAKLPLEGYELLAGHEQRHGIEGCRLRVKCDESHHHRSWSTIDRMLAESRLAPEISDLARRFFRRLGQAEAKVHGISLDKVHFHEVGAVDAIIDLTGAAIGLQLLGIDKLLCAPLPLSRGMSQCAHGALPLPAPAVLELLQGLPIVDSGCDKELVTPTGATIIAERAEIGPLPAITIDRTGYGVGGWQLEDRPNLLRGILGEVTTSAVTAVDKIQLLESHIDDSTPEQLGFLLEQLFEAGALDAAYSPLQMKKNRPATRLTVVCETDQAAQLARLIMHESSAIGVRSSACERFKLLRRSAAVTTELGEARVKLLYDGEQFLRLSPEYDDCRQLAQANRLPLQQVYRQVTDSAYQQLRPEQTED
ncbi:MAG: nickel pincer cofactor biosynthesis protein LarC [Deltaproteobacteria bacterium]|nr:nickel pincer cofactor biosynthesis protein LarC [Deltaproteobacteria bacterium]